MKILFTLCGRAGSKGLASKNLLSLYNKPLIHYAQSLIELFSAKYPEYYIDTVLNTDSTKLQKLAMEKNSHIIIVEREAEHANDTVGKIEAIRDAYLKVKKDKKVDYDFVIDLDLTSPLRTLKDLENLIQTYVSDRNKDLVFSVVPSRRNPYFNMVKSVNGDISLVNSSTYTSRQQAPDVYDINGSMYLYSPKFLTNHTYLFDGSCGIFIMKDYRVLDIDDGEDFEWMNFIMPKLLEENEQLKEIYDN